MINIQMVDLKSQYEKIKPEIDQAIAEVLNTTQFIGGPVVNSFKKNLEKYLNVEHVIPCANGTDALQIALMALGLKPGDEVITPSFTYIATVEVVALLGLTPVFVDVDPENYNILPEAIQNAITPRTKAIIPVHLYGQCAPMEEILKVAKAHNIPVIEDTAQAIGCTYTFSDGTKMKAGTMGTIGTTSFFPSKNLGCYGDGGAIFTRDTELAGRLQMIANHGQKVRYYHEVVGCNSRLDAIQAAILNVKLPHLDTYCASRRAAADYYDNAFKDSEYITTPKRASEYTEHVFHQYTLKLNPSIDREALRKYLEDKGIPSMIYYPVASHEQNMFNHYHKVVCDLTNTLSLSPIVLSLPIHTEMDEKQLSYISQAVLDGIAELTK